MEITPGLLMCGAGVTGIIISSLALIGTIHIFAKQRKRLLERLEQE